MLRYTCQTELVLGEQMARCSRPEEYRARDNRARYAHQCRECWSRLEDSQKGEYVLLRAVELTPAWCRSCGAVDSIADGRCEACGSVWGGRPDFEEAVSCGR